MVKLDYRLLFDTWNCISGSLEHHVPIVKIFFTELLFHKNKYFVVVNRNAANLGFLFMTFFVFKDVSELMRNDLYSYCEITPELQII